MNRLKLTIVVFTFLSLALSASAQFGMETSSSEHLPLEKVTPLLFSNLMPHIDAELAYLSEEEAGKNAQGTAQKASPNPPLSAESNQLPEEGQSQDSLQSGANLFSPLSGLTLKPRIGLGFGTLTFFGDVGSNEGGYHPGNSNLAYQISVTNEFNSYLDFRLYAIFGKITVNERDHDRRYNFNTEMRIGGASVSYNFNHLIKRKTFLEPFISLGVESFEYSSKTDLKDANGNYYNYWSDGTIRSIAENDPNAGEAVLLRRDYSYETDLREMDMDGVGKYQQRSWAIPLGIGVNLNVTKRFEVRFSSTYHFTLTDNIDNVSTAGEGMRKGNSKNDQYFYNSLSLNYDLNITPQQKEMPKSFDELGQPKEGPLANVDMDGDTDGVHDFVDKCLGTPAGVEVDKDGCPVDSDKDGVPDYYDMEPSTAENATVNSDGITVTDEEFYQKYLFWVDSLSVKENFASIHVDKDKIKEYYALKVGSDKNGLSQEQINQLLAMKDVRSLSENDETVYLVGQFEDMSDAITRKLVLENQGLATIVVQNRVGGLADVSKAADKAEVDFVAGMNTSELLEHLNELEPSMAEGEVLYRVQIGAFRYKLSDEVFDNVPEIVSIKGKDGLTRYSSGTFSRLDKAAERKVELLMNGFEGAFIAAYKGGQRVTLASTGAHVAEGAEDEVIDQANNPINKNAIHFRVQLGAYEHDIPTKVLDKFFKIGNVKPMNFGDGIIRYMTSQNGTYAEAKKILSQAVAEGIEDAFIVGDFNGKFISAEEARRLSNDSVDSVENN